jgi:outer membrane lipoprotein SlyB
MTGKKSTRRASGRGLLKREVMSDAAKVAGSSMSQRVFAAAFSTMALLLAGCASSLGANSYGRDEIGAVSRVDEGVVVASRAIIIEGSEAGSKVGTATGAIVGGIAGSQVGGGDDERAIGGVVGAVAGGVLGNMVGKAATKKPGFAYTVRLRSGDLVTVTQGGDVAIANGTPVLIEYGDRTRVIPQGASIGY